MVIQWETAVTYYCSIESHLSRAFVFMKKYYRNLVSITSPEGIEVDEGSLWELKDNHLLVLVDEDQYVSCPFDAALFVEAEL